MAHGVEDFQAGDDRDEWLNYWLAKRVEPRLGQDGPEVITHYPASQASLAAITTDELGTPVAERFELYWRGVELANGFRELTDADELRQRLEGANRLRTSRGVPALPLPERMLSLMTTHGLPPTTGVALGFDRLAMLILGANSIDEVLWQG
jgi:lysyl-tRNA synthetase class 2